MEGFVCRRVAEGIVCTCMHAHYIGLLHFAISVEFLSSFCMTSVILRKPGGRFAEGGRKLDPFHPSDSSHHSNTLKAATRNSA